MYLSSNPLELQTKYAMVASVLETFFSEVIFQVLFPFVNEHKDQSMRQLAMMKVVKSEGEKRCKGEHGYPV
jgi:hypothetical protein